MVFAKIDPKKRTIPRGGKPPFDLAYILAIFNQKGGCGKTTTSMELAGALGLRGYRTMVLDLDPQHSAVDRCGNAGLVEDGKPFPATVVPFDTFSGRSFGMELEKHAHNYDFIILDCPPRIESRGPWYGLIFADMGIIPVQPTASDIQAIRKAIELGKSAQEENPDLTLHVLPAIVSSGYLYSAFMERLKALVKEEGLEMIPTQLSRVTAFPTAEAMGATVLTVGTRSKAVGETNALADWVIRSIAKRRAA